MPLNRSRYLVRDLMQIGVTTCPGSTTIAELAEIMLSKNLFSVVILDPGDGNAIGLVDQSDLMRAFSLDHYKELTAEQVMQESIPQIPADIPLKTAIQMMLDNHLQTYYLMHHSGGISYPAAYFSYRNVLRLLAAMDEKDLADIGIEREKRLPLDEFYKKRDVARRSVFNK
jgi:CBS domain-containing protein